MNNAPVLDPKALLFDWDNTLVDTWPCIIQAMNVTLVEMGQAAWSEEEAKARIAKSMRDSFPTLFGDRWLEAKDIFLNTFQSVHLEMLETLQGAEDLLKALHEAGVYLGVVSNKTGAFLRAEAEQLGWTKYFGALVGAGDAANDKPASDPVHMALEPAGIGPSKQVWFVGDNAVDIQCGVGSGCQSVLLHPDGNSLKQTMNPAPHYVFCDCSDFMSFLQTQTVPFQVIR